MMRVLNTLFHLFSIIPLLIININPNQAFAPADFRISKKVHPYSRQKSEFPIHSPSIRLLTTNLHASKLPSWSDFHHLIPSLTIPNPQQNIDSALNPTQPKYSQITPTLFRERHGWCPYSERAWLAVESKNIPYDTIRIDNTGPGVKPPYYRGTTPQMKWEDGTTQGESMDLIQVLDEKTYPAPALEPGFLYPSTLDVSNKIEKWRDIFPNGARPSSRAAFLFSWNGEPLSKSEFERVLR